MDGGRSCEGAREGEDGESDLSVDEHGSVAESRVVKVGRRRGEVELRGEDY